MKMFKFFPLACAAIMMCACSSDDPGDGKGNPNVAGEAQYLAVNIVNVGTTPTRAADYEGGIGNESKINRIRFYFFHADGSPYILKNTTKDDANWLEVENPTLKPATGNPSTVDKVTDAILVINGVTNSAPSKVIAIVNPETLTKLDADKKTLNDLLNPLVYKTFVTGVGTAADGFVMSNSVYASEGRTVCANDISSNVKQTADDAKKKPVDIYMERVVAKVRAKLNDTNFDNGTTKWNNGKPGIKVGTYSSHDIYAVVDGWGVADENDQANLVKQITSSWTSTDLGFGSLLWTTADYHRCFWETSAAFSTTKPVNHTFEEYKNQSNGYVYTLPNTSTSAISTTVKNAKYNNNTRTKFLVATHLMYLDGTTWKNAELCTYKGIDYLGVDVLKKQIAFESGYYRESTTTPGTYERITEAEITFKKATTGGDYLVVPALVTGKTYYKKDGTEAAPTYKEDTNPSISNETAQVRTEGMAYYYVPIKHLGLEGEVGEYGIVRNHLYDINVTKMEGFGTPVYDKTWEIIPTVPEETKTYLAAKINVLQWRVVPQNVNLDHK